MIVRLQVMHLHKAHFQEPVSSQGIVDNNSL